MSYPVYGRYQAPEPPSLRSLHLPTDHAKWKTVDHETPLGVLDQSDLLAQDIHCSRFIPGCQTDPDALGSCTANATIADLAQKLPEAKFVETCGQLVNGAQAPTGLTDTAGAERAAISFYHACTDQTGDPSTEWPPTDCGSSGPYIVKELETLDIVHGEQVTHGAAGIVSLLQTGPVLMGSPWLYAWEEPGREAFIDGNGSKRVLEEQISQGVAGGHETLIVAIEHLALSKIGHVLPATTVLRVRNSWSASWGDGGCYRVHLSTLVALGGQCDFRQTHL